MSSRRPGGTIGPDLVVHGKLDGKSDLRIEGIFEGEIDIEGTLSIGPEGRVRGPARVVSLEVEGELHGDVDASESVHLRPGGRLLGDVRARRVAIDDGGSLQGGIDMEFESPAGVS